MVQITIPGGLFGSGGFDPLALQRQAEERGRAEREYQAAEAAKLAALKEEVAERNRLQAEADAAKVALIQPANISSYYDALRAGEDPSEFADILQSSLADQGYLTTGFEMAEAGAYAPVEDLFIVPGGVDTSNVGEFKFDKTLEDFKGYDFDYGNISNENLKKFQEELMPVMAPAVAEAQLEGQSYQNALIQAYERSPEVQEIYSKYGISPQRISKEWGSEYVYDPFTFGEIQTVDRSKGAMDYVGDVVQAALPAIAGAGLFGPLAGSISSGIGAPAALQPALTGALTGAATAGATGGDPLTAALSGGLGGFAEPFIAGADLGTLGTAGARGLTSAAIAEAVGGDPLQAGLTAAGMSLLGDTLAERKEAAKETIQESVEQLSSETGVELSEAQRNQIEQDIKAAIDIDDDYLSDVQAKIIEEFGGIEGKLTDLQYRDQLFAKGGQRAVDLVFGGEGAYTTGLLPRQKVSFPSDYSQTYGGIGSVIPDYLRRTVADPYARAGGATVTYDLESLPVEALDRVTLQQIRAQTGGGGGGGAPVTEITAPTMASTYTPSSAPAMTMPSVTPAIAPPSTFSLGAATGASILPIAGLMASAATTPVSSTVSTGAGATAPAGGQVSGQADSTEPSGEGEVGVDTAGTEAAGGGEGGTGGGEATGEGIGTGTGTGTGVGTGDGSGSGAGRGAGYGAGTSITELVFSDFLNPYEDPGLLKYVTNLPGYQAPQYSQRDYAQTVADQIRNLTSFRALTQEQVQKSLGLFNDNLLQEAVMQNLYGASGR